MSSLTNILGSHKSTWMKATNAESGAFTDPKGVVYRARNYVKIDFEIYNRMMDGASKSTLIVANKMLQDFDHFTNLFVGTYDEIQELTGLSRTAVITAMAELLDADFIRKKRNGLWMINPAAAIGCHDRFFDNLMTKYYNLDFNSNKKNKNGGNTNVDRQCL